MEILFTKGSSSLSKAITDLTDEPVSHCALQLGNFAIHSNLLGLNITWFSNFIKHSEVVYRLERLDKQEERRDLHKLSNLLEKYEHTLYDFGALLFLGIVFFLRSTFKIPLPKSNLWQSSGMFLCVEFISKFIDDKEDSMITPYKLYLKLIREGQWEEVSNGN